MNCFLSSRGRQDRQGLAGMFLSLGAFLWGWRKVRRAEVSGKVKGALQGVSNAPPVRRSQCGWIGGGATYQLGDTGQVIQPL